MIPAILGIAPETSRPAVTALEVWDRLVNGTPDRLADVKDVARAITRGLELLLPDEPGVVKVVKSALWHTTDAWAVDGPPGWWVYTCQYLMMQARAQTARVGLLISGGAWRAGYMGADESIQDEIAEGVRRFLEMVDSRTPPPPSDVIDLPIIKSLYDRGDEPSVLLTPEALTVWERLKELRKLTADGTSEAKVIEATIRAAMKNSSEAVLTDGRRLALRKWGRDGKRLVELD